MKDEIHEITIEIGSCKNCQHLETQHFEEDACFMPDCKCKLFTPNLK
jgi:hypothetical protein